MSNDEIVVDAAEVEALEAALDASEDHDALLAALKERGGHAGNTALMGVLGWEEARYWRVRGSAIEAGDIKKGRGKGGSVTLIEETDDKEAEAPEREDAAVEPGSKPRERDLYAGAYKAISETWWREENYDDARAEITAAQGRKDTGGRWTRPDITVAAIKSYVYFPDAVFDIVTFEIKPKDQVNVLGVFEAIAHRESGTRSYVLFEGSTETLSEAPEWERILEIAGRYGIGVFSAETIDDFETWEELAESRRVQSDPANIDKFIRTSLSDATKNEIIKWQK